MFAVIQFAEGYLLRPLIDRRTVPLPPAVTISMQVLLGNCLEWQAWPWQRRLMPFLWSTVMMLYVQDVLDHPVKTPNEK